jgi:hypothetical protein
MTRRRSTQLHELIGDADDRVALAQFQKRPGPTTVLWWHRAPTAHAHRVVPPWIEWQHALDAHVVLPAICEVVLVDEPLADAQTKIGQAYVSGIVTEADPAVMTDAVFTAVNDEAVQVLIGPAESRL